MLSGKWSFLGLGKEDFMILCMTTKVQYLQCWPKPKLLNEKLSPWREVKHEFQCVMFTVTAALSWILTGSYSLLSQLYLTLTSKLTFSFTSLFWLLSSLCNQLKFAAEILNYSLNHFSRFIFIHAELALIINSSTSGFFSMQYLLSLSYLLGDHSVYPTDSYMFFSPTIFSDFPFPILCFFDFTPICCC